MYRFYIDGVLLPVNPSKLETKINSKNKTLVMLNEGEVNILKTPGLSKVSFEALFPNVQYPFAQYTDGFEDASYYLNKLEELKSSLLPFRFIVTRLSPAGKLLFNSNMSVSLEDYTIKEDAENYGTDVSVKIELKQYRTFATKVFTISEDGTTATIQQNRDSKEIEEFYIIQESDTLYEIARTELGDGEEYTTLMELNGIDNTNDITAGQVIRLV